MRRLRPRGDAWVGSHNESTALATATTMAATAATAAAVTTTISPPAAAAAATALGVLRQRAAPQAATARQGCWIHEQTAAPRRAAAGPVWMRLGSRTAPSELTSELGLPKQERAVGEDERVSMCTLLHKETVSSDF